MIGTKAALRVAVATVACGAVTVLVGLGALLHWWGDPGFVRAANRAPVCGPDTGSLHMNGACLTTDPYRVVGVERGGGPGGSGTWLHLKPVSDFHDSCADCDNTTRGRFAGSGPVTAKVREGDTVNATSLGFVGILEIERDGVTQKSLDNPLGAADVLLARALMVLTAGGVLLASGGRALRSAGPLRVNPLPGPSPRPT
ncbi:hypothetical protein OG897_25235 [Streptomyces sp. NBC_00237]|uniref:hypothetical protein n=1 Tax=Streptomyces sp. NBC_00237 TaxID=2975687 RepID=UPI00224EB5BF|nr:hypothetical protein [Streptomyces sp. NBC_00237]MCX5204747.1 hypothetical protein [Streptomyces sp. NBC_00237]